MHHLALTITYHEDCDLNFGSWRTIHCQFWLEANLYGVRDVTHRGLRGLTAFWPSVCPLGWSIIHVGVMHLSLWLCIVSSTKRSGVGEWQTQFNASSSIILQQEPSSTLSLVCIVMANWRGKQRWPCCCACVFNIWLLMTHTHRIFEESFELTLQSLKPKITFWHSVIPCRLGLHANVQGMDTMAQTAIQYNEI